MSSSHIRAFNTCIYIYTCRTSDRPCYFVCPLTTRSPLTTAGQRSSITPCRHTAHHLIHRIDSPQTTLATHLKSQVRGYYQLDGTCDLLLYTHTQSLPVSHNNNNHHSYILHQQQTSWGSESSTHTLLNQRGAKC